MFEILTSQNRYAILYRLARVRAPEARSRRIAEFVGMLARQETIHPQRRRLGPVVAAAGEAADDVDDPAGPASTT
jgi:hypothetical protein